MCIDSFEHIHSHSDYESYMPYLHVFDLEIMWQKSLGSERASLTKYLLTMRQSPQPSYCIPSDVFLSRPLSDPLEAYVYFWLRPQEGRRNLKGFGRTETRLFVRFGLVPLSER